ncbi:unnamed protein product [Rangifer tarandus platyrhynchus]|uniref:Uncharacterized protein n=1 Tax=Rangifer tarandus platyrhynchus TaxID=3082113 RepID=A0AC59ZE41_RANTA
MRRCQCTRQAQTSEKISVGWDQASVFEDPLAIPGCSGITGAQRTRGSELRLLPESPGLNRERSQASAEEQRRAGSPELARVMDGLPRPLLAKVRHRPSMLRGCEPRRSSPPIPPKVALCRHLTVRGPPSSGLALCFVTRGPPFAADSGVTVSLRCRFPTSLGRSLPSSKSSPGQICRQIFLYGRVPPLESLASPCGSSQRLSTLKKYQGRPSRRGASTRTRPGPTSKAWCKVSTLVCTRLVTSSVPGALGSPSGTTRALASLLSMWSPIPRSQTTTVTMTGLREEDSGHYWYRIYHTSGCSVSKPVKFYPVVSPGEPLPRDPLTPFWCLLITVSWKSGCPPLAESPGEVVGNMCPGDSDMHTHTHTRTHPFHTLSPWFTSLLKDAQTEPNTHLYAIHNLYCFGKDPVQLC